MIKKTVNIPEDIHKYLETVKRENYDTFNHTLIMILKEGFKNYNNQRIIARMDKTILAMKHKIYDDENLAISFRKRIMQLESYLAECKSKNERMIKFLQALNLYDDYITKIQLDLIGRNPDGTARKQNANNL